MSSTSRIEVEFGGPAYRDRNIQLPKPEDAKPGSERDTGEPTYIDKDWSRRKQRRAPATVRDKHVTQLSVDEERALAKRIKRGDKSAQEQLIIANLALVLRAVRDYKRSGLPFDDLVQEGNLGLIRAAQSFDPFAHNARFATYARFWIQSSLLRAVAINGSLMQLPERSRLLRSRYRRAIWELCHRVPAVSDASNWRPPSLDEIARHMGVSARRLKWLGLIKCDQPSYLHVSQLTMAEDASPVQDVLNEETRSLVHVALGRLSQFEAWIIRERFGLGALSLEKGDRSNLRWRSDSRNKSSSGAIPGGSGVAPVCSLRPSEMSEKRTYSEIGHECGLAAGRVRQVEKTALEKLRVLLLGRHV
jgi:RNA polymerase primary sigma factor